MAPFHLSVMAMPVVFFRMMMEVLVFEGDMVMQMYMSLGCQNNGPCKEHTECDYFCFSVLKVSW